MPLGNRVGELPAVELSIRCHVTVAGSEASALCVTKIRPAEVAAHSVPWSAPSRASQEIDPPPRSAPYTVPVRSPGWLMHDGIVSVLARPSQYGPPSGRKSPQPSWLPPTTNSGQLAS